MEGKLKLVEERVPMGAATVKALFGTGKRRVAGCVVTEGKLLKVRRGHEAASVRLCAWCPPHARQRRYVRKQFCMLRKEQQRL